jgi:hypothetical protein
MKTIKIFCMVVTAIIVLSQTRTIAQSETSFQTKKEQIESQKVAFITTKLNLTTEESKNFWPIYNEYETKKEAIRKEFKTANKLESTDSLTETEAKDRITAELKMEQDLLDLKVAYATKFQTVLPATKVLKFQKSELEFKKVLLKTLKDKPKKDLK